MSSINAVGSNSPIYQPVTHPSAQTKPAAPATANPASSGGHDPDHDGDTDGPGLDVNG
jgi:hypothetical protein